MRVIVGITSTIRPKIIEETLLSFTKNLFNDYKNKISFIINIDCIGESRNHWDVISIFKKFLGCYPIYYNISNLPSFSMAFYNIWRLVSFSKGDYFFNLEDDWKLLQKIDLNKMIQIMECEEKLAILRLPAFDCGKGIMKNWNLFYPWGGLYYKCPDELKLTAGFCGHPSLIKMDFVKNIFPLIDKEKNPEKQFHQKGGKWEKEIMKWEYGVYGIPGKSKFIEDIGRNWMIEQEWRKSGNKAFFTNWVKEGD